MKKRTIKKFEVSKGDDESCRVRETATSGDSVVEFYAHKPTRPVKFDAFTPSQLIEGVQDGLPVCELDALQEMLDLPIEQLAPKLGISKATLHRRKLQGHLIATESDRVVRFARLMGKAVEVFETQENARRWLKAPQIGLGGAAPLDYAETEIGAREVEDLLGRIEYGVYS